MDMIMKVKPKNKANFGRKTKTLPENITIITSNCTKTMGILAWVILGGLAGWIGSLIMKTDASQGILLNIVVGIVGAFIGGLIFNFFGGEGITGFNLYSLVVAIVGSVFFIWITKLIQTSTQ